jgi:O-antigen/teichoic acid export membrane protein
VLGQLAAVSGALLGVRLLTELLDPAAYGELALAMTVATLVNQVLLGPIGGGITRFYAPAQEQSALGDYLRASSRLVLLATAVILAALLLALAALQIAGQGSWIAVTVGALAFAVLSGWSAVLSSIQAAARQRLIVAWHQGLESWLRFLLAALLLVWLGADSSVAMAGYALALVLVLASQCYFFRDIARYATGGGVSTGAWQARIWSFSWPIAVFGVFTWMQLASDRWALGLFATKQEVGLYAVLFQLGYFPISLVSGMVASFLAPIFYQRAGDASDGLRNAGVNRISGMVTWCSLGITAVAVLAASLLHGPIFRLLAAPQYHSVSALLPWVVLAGGVFAASQSLSLALMSKLKTRSMMPAKIGTAVLGVVLNLAGAYWFGMTGIVFAGVLFSILFFSWILLVFRSEALGA